MNINNAVFVKSAVKPDDFIRDGLPCIVFSGRSNVGKSSVINTLLSRKNFARVGQLPGKTVHINYFLVGGCAYFVDLPGYGYAKVSQAERQRWGKLMEDFFAERLISLGVLIVDARHKPSADDVTMADWFMQTGCPLTVVANKCDKAKKSELEQNMERISQTLGVGGDVSVLPFSAVKGTGRLELLEIIRGYCE